ncbi:MAG: Hsp20/alpha crystallin family protein [Deltaproteobacteria bacterium]|nr:Hsp20/alpha crystallin family protein [Deltaproteobacteria bacterium]
MKKTPLKKTQQNARIQLKNHAEYKKVIFPLSDLNITDNEKNASVFLDSAGTGTKRIEVRLEGDRFLVEGKKIPQEGFNLKMIFHEYLDGFLNSQITLSDSLNLSHIEANLFNGQLRLKVSNKLTAKSLNFN